MATTKKKFRDERFTAKKGELVMTDRPRVTIVKPKKAAKKGK